MIFLAVGFIIGTILGSLVKALADRSLTNSSFWGRSYCPSCQKSLRWYDLFPVFSYLVLKGRCRYCGDKISLEYLLVEVVMGFLIAFLFWQAQPNFPGFSDYFKFSLFALSLIFKIFFISVLAIITLTDIKKMFIPDRVIIPAILITLIYLVVQTSVKIWYLYYSLSLSTIGRLLLPPHSDYFQRHALIIAEPLTFGLLMAFLIGGFFTLLIILTKGKGMGGGDVKLGGLIGLGLGFPLSLVALILAFLSGAIYGIVMIILGKKRFGQNIPFGPFLVLGSLITLFWGSQIFNWYLNFVFYFG